VFLDLFERKPNMPTGQGTQGHMIQGWDSRRLQNGQSQAGYMRSKTPAIAWREEAAAESGQISEILAPCINPQEISVQPLDVR